MDSFVMWIVDILILSIFFPLVIHVGFDSEISEETRSIKVWALISLGTFLVFFFVPWLVTDPWDRVDLFFKSGLTFFWLPLVGIPFVITCKEIIEFLNVRNKMKKAKTIKEKLNIEINRIKQINQQINEYLEKYNIVCDTVRLLDILNDNALINDYKNKMTAFFKDLLNSNQLTSKEFYIQGKQDLVKVIGDFNINIDSLPRVCNKIDTMTYNDLIKIWRNVKKNPYAFIVKVEELL